MTLEEADGEIRIEAYTARTLLSGLNLRYAFQVFEKHLPDDMCAENLPKENKAAKMPKMREQERPPSQKEAGKAGKESGADQCQSTGCRASDKQG